MILSSASTSDHFAVTDTSAQSTAMVAGLAYRYCCTVDSYITIGADPTASAADNNHVVAAGREIEILALTAAKVAAIRIGSTSGVASLSLVM